MNKKTFFLILLVILFSSFVYSQPPFQEPIEGNFLDVVFPKDEFFKSGSTFDLHFHVTNSSGSALTNDLFDCFIHIYGVDNEHLLISNLTPSSNDFDKEIEVNDTITNNLGVHPYNIFCNSSQGEYGFISSEFTITNSGKGIDLEPINWISIMVSITLLTILLFFISNMIKNKDLLLTKILFFFLGVINTLFLGIMPLLISQNYSGFTPKNLWVLFAIISVLTLFIFIWNYFVKVILKALRSFKKNKKKDIGREEEEANINSFI